LDDDAGPLHHGSVLLAQEKVAACSDASNSFDVT
jgi:hypothetical protein